MNNSTTRLTQLRDEIARLTSERNRLRPRDNREDAHRDGEITRRLSVINEAISEITRNRTSAR